MRKIFAIIMLVGVMGLLAQIPAGTKSVNASANIGDILADDFEYHIGAYAGYFFMDGIEGVLGIEFMGTTVEDVDAIFGFTAGGYYHFPFSEMMGAYAGAMFGYTSTGDGYMYIPIDAGLELFLTENNAVRIYNSFELWLDENIDNKNYIRVGTVHYF